MEDVQRLDRPLSPAVRQTLMDAMKACEQYLADNRPQRVESFRTRTFQCPVCGNQGRSPETVDCAVFCRRLVLGCAVKALRDLRLGA